MGKQLKLIVALVLGIILLIISIFILGENSKHNQILIGKQITKSLKVEFDTKKAEIEKEEAEKKKAEEEKKKTEQSSVTENISYYSPYDLKSQGVIYWGGYRFTWYSEKVLPGGGLDIPGRYSDGNFVRDGDGYLCVASNDLSRGTIVETPWGTAKVYDSGCASGTIDMYVSW